MFWILHFIITYEHVKYLPYRMNTTED